MRFRLFYVNTCDRFCVVEKKAQKSGDLGTVLDRFQEDMSTLRRVLGTPPLDADELLEHGLLLAKSELSDEEMAKTKLFYGFGGLFPSPGHSGQLDLSAKWWLKNSARRAELRDWWAGIEPERAKFRARLAELKDTPNKALGSAKADVKILRQQLVIVPDISAEGKLTHRFFPRTIEAFYCRLLLNLHQPKRQARLIRCKRVDCRAFFLRKILRQGGRPRDYCSPECQSKADQKKALPRQKRKRMLDRQKRKRKRDRR